MVLRTTVAVLAAFVLSCTVVAVDCARMCMLRGGGMPMDCWFARRTGLACDIGTLILLILVDLVAASIALYLWSLSPRRA
jgi:hypothetical protein